MPQPIALNDARVDQLRALTIRLEVCLADAKDVRARFTKARAIQGICQQRIREKAVAYAEIHDEVAALVTTLARRGVELAVISNGFEEDVLGWSHCSLAAEIRCTVFSYAERTGTIRMPWSLGRW